MVSVAACLARSAMRVPHLLSGARGLAAAAPSIAKTERASALSPDEFIALAVTRSVELSHNTKMIELALPHVSDNAGLITSSFIMVQGSRADVAKPYTPVSASTARGTIRLVVKRYDGGEVSSHLHSLRPGDSVQVKGPIFKLKYVPNTKKRIGMVAGGTGITPMLQVVREILENPEDNTQISLLFANSREADIILKDEIDSLAAAHENFRVCYVLSHPAPTWTGYRGYINSDIIGTFLPPPLGGIGSPLIYVCGPPGMMQAVSGSKAPDKSQGDLQGLLKDAGYSGKLCCGEME